MTREYEETMWGLEHDPATLLERILWFGAGANARALERCPHSDRVKYQGIGGVVWATGLLAFLSGSYAFYTVFCPKTDTALNTTTDLPTMIKAVVAGVVWAGIIFNLDRFIVSSTGKGDGTERITRAEFTNALPRLGMAVIIGLCMSAPLEIRVLQPEIESQLSLEQMDFEKDLNAKDLVELNTTKSELRDKIAKNEQILKDSAARFEARRKEILAERSDLEKEAEGLSASGHAGRGPVYLAKKDNLDAMEDERKRDELAAERENQPAHEEIVRAKADIEASEAKYQENAAAHKKQSHSRDGLLERIHIAHKIGGFIPWVITGLLLSIECGPIFFKLMLIKGTYDYMEENEKHVRAANLGVVSATHLLVDEKNNQVVTDKFLQAERIKAEKENQLATQNALSRVTHEHFREKTAREIKLDPTKFIVGHRDSEG